jgi:hypothetical protein
MKCGQEAAGLEFRKTQSWQGFSANFANRRLPVRRQTATIFLDHRSSYLASALLAQNKRPFTRAGIIPLTSAGSAFRRARPISGHGGQNLFGVRPAKKIATPNLNKRQLLSQNGEKAN